MAKNQKHYTPEFKQQLVDLHNAGGTSYPQLELDYGVNRSTLSGWVKQLSPIKVSEFVCLCQTIMSLKTCNDILIRYNPSYRQKHDYFLERN